MSHSSKSPTKRNRFVITLRGSVVDVCCVGAFNHTAACAVAAELLGVTEDDVMAMRLEW